MIPTTLSDSFQIHRLKAALLRKLFWFGIYLDHCTMKSTNTEIVHSIPIMLIVSTGRTGTTWLSKTLSIENGIAYHEPISNEQFSWAAAFNDMADTDWYAAYRIKYIARQIRHTSAQTYIEANGSIRRHIKALKAIAPKIYITHVIRDGRAVASSVMNRNSITEKDPIYWAVKSNRPLGGKYWKDMTKFEIVCQLWRLENEYMLANANHSVRFEDMITDYDAFLDAFCEPIGININYEDWYRRTSCIDNRNHKRAFPEWDGWTKDQRSYFSDCCGDMMHRLGYSF